MIIANPLYDVVFKKLMENEKVARFFIGTLLDQEVTDVQVKPQEYTWQGEFEEGDPKAIEIIAERIRKRHTIWVYRLDFVATVRTETGEYKKVLIEIQKAKNATDLMRFRNYLAEQYKKEDRIGDEQQLLPVTTIYILGFQLPEIESACLRVKRQYVDMITHTVLDRKSDFVEKLTHDCIVVQTGRITERYQTRIDKLLSIFAQRHFADDREILKDYRHTPDLEEIKMITDLLHYVGTDPGERRQIEIEQEAWRTITAMFAEKEKRYEKAMAAQQKALEEQQKALEEQQKALEEQQRALEEQQKTLEERQKALDEKDQLIATLKRKLEG